MSMRKQGRHAAHAKKSDGNPQKNSAVEQSASSSAENKSSPLNQDDRAQGESVDPSQTTVMPEQPGYSSGSQAIQNSVGSLDYSAGGPMLPIDVNAVGTKRRRKPLKIVGITAGVLIGLLAILYVVGAIVFMDRFMPNTTMGDMDVSLKSSSEVQRMLSEVVDDYALKVEGQGFSLKLSSHDAGMKLDGHKVTEAMHESVNPWLWPFEITQSHDETEKFAASYNESGLGDKVRVAVDEFNKNATPPTNAAIAFDENTATFIVQPEAVGTALSYEAVIEAIDKATVVLAPSVKLTKDELQQPSVLATDVKLITACKSANELIAADFALTMAGSTAAEVNALLVSQWIVFAEDLSVSLNEEALVAWVDQLASDCDTIGTERTYTRADGKVITVAGGPYGWAVDRDTLLGIVKDGVSSGRTETVEVPCSSTGNAYNGPGARDWGNRYCDIDLSEQYVRFYDGAGTLIWESLCVTGTPNGSHNTPTGVFWMNQMASPSKLKGTNLDGTKYESTVQYWMPFDGNVIGLHDADWQTSFGGTRYRDGAGSHGCVNLPPYKAAELFGIIQSGDTVVSHW